MKAKTIKSVLRKKINEWADSIEDVTLRHDVKKDAIVTGGCIVSMLVGEKVNDYDIYLKNYSTVLALTKYYVNKFNHATGRGAEVDTKDEGRVKILIKSSGIASEDGNPLPEEDDVVVLQPEVDSSKPKYRPVFLSSNAITLSNSVQIIIRFYGEADKIHKNYDFIHCTCFYDSGENRLELPQAALESIITRELRYVGSLYPLCSIIRTRKFIKRNWAINAGQYLKMCLQLNDLDLKNPAILEDQLTGVDIAYFEAVLEAVKTKENITTGYLIEVIDRIF